MNEAHTKLYDHLGLVAAMIDELEIVKTIDKQIEQDMMQRKVSIGECVKAMILNGLGFVNNRLYMIPHFFENKPLELLFKKDIEPSMLNDDVLGRALDKLHEAGVSYLFQEISEVACRKLKIGEETFHIDGTSFHLHGKYDNQEEGSDMIEIKQGYSRDHHPELVQVVLDMIVGNKSGIPLAMRPLSGNNSDKKDFPKVINEFINNLKYEEIEALTFIGDSAMFTAETLKMFPKGMKFISRVPENIRMVKDIYNNIDINELTPIDDKYSYYECKTEYAGIEQRWIVLFSKASYERSLKTFNKNKDKKVAEEIKKFEKLTKKHFACEKDAINEAQLFFDKCEYISGSELTINKEVIYKSKGRPSVKSDKVAHYYISSKVFTDESKTKKEEQKLGYFVLATNHIEKYSPEEILKLYKDQGNVERGFRFLKNPTFLASSMYLEKQERIEALMFVMTLCLMVYSALEYRIRKELKVRKLTYTNQVKKEIDNPTARWVFLRFNGVHILYMDNQKFILNLKDHHKKIINMLGQNYLNYYS
jgi:transposase